MSFRKRTIIQCYIFVTCLVTFTKSYVLFAYILGTSVAVITSIFFIGNLVLIFHLQKDLYKWKTIIVFGLFFIVLPVVVSILNIDASITSLLLQFFYMSQLLVGAASILRFIESMKKALIASIFINLVVGLLSVVSPMLFEPLTVINDTMANYGGRAIGFFLQPNAFGLASVVLLILASVLCSKRSFQFLYPILLITCIISFSRSAIGLFLIVSFVLFAFKIYQQDLKIRDILKFFFSLGIVLFVLFGIIMMSPYRTIVDNIESYQQVYTRVAFFLEFNPSTISKDASLESRENYQQRYIEQLPVFFVKGEGIGSQSEAIELGELAGNAHQTHLELLYQGGFIYWLSFILVLFNILYIAWKNRTLNKEKALLALQIFVFMFVFSFFSTGMLQMRELFLAMGVLIQFRAPNYLTVFRKHHSNEKF